MTEKAIEGWENIAKFFGVHRSTVLRRRQELQQCGAIFYMTTGSPPHRCKRVYAFPSSLKAWIARKSAKGGTF